VDPIQVLIGAGISSFFTVAVLRKLRGKNNPDSGLGYPINLVVERSCEVWAYPSAAARERALPRNVTLPRGTYPLTELEDPSGLPGNWLVTKYQGQLYGRQGDSWRDAAVESDTGYHFTLPR